MPAALQYYRQEPFETPEHSLLISGQCPEVKRAFLSRVLQKAASNRAAIVIDYGRTGNFAEFLRCCGFGEPRVFTAGEDNYAPCRVSLRDEILGLRTRAQRQGCSASETAMMTAFLGFLAALDTEREINSVKALLQRFRTQEALEQTLTERVRSRLLTRSEAQLHIRTYLEYAESGITADLLLSEIGFLTTPHIGGQAFSLENMRSGEAAILRADQNNSTDMNEQITRLWTRDILKLCERCPLVLIINTAHHPQLERCYETVETLSHSENASVFYTSYDLFRGADEHKAAAFAGMFEYNIFGTHAGVSAEIISRLFGERRIAQLTYTEARNKRILGEKLLDKMLKTDRTVSVMASPVRERVIPAEDIIALSPNEYIVFDTLRCAVRFGAPIRAC